MSFLQAARGTAVRLVGGQRLSRHDGTGALTGMVLLLPKGWEGLYVLNSYEPCVTAALTRIVRRGDICLDAGAHYGYFTLLLARLCGPEGTVISFEAQPDNARVVRANVRANGLAANVVFEQAAVSASDGTIELHASSSGGSTEWTIDEGFAHRAPTPSPVRAVMRVPSIALGSYLASANRLDVIKMDIEGAEAEVVPALTALLARLRPTVMLEFHRPVGWPAIEALIDSGYEFEDLNGDALPTPRGSDDVPYQLLARAQRA